MATFTNNKLLAGIWRLALNGSYSESGRNFEGLRYTGISFALETYLFSAFVTRNNLECSDKLAYYVVWLVLALDMVAEIFKTKDFFIVHQA